MTESRIENAAAEELFARAYESGCTIEESAQRWISAAAPNYPEVCIRLGPDELGRYSVDPAASGVIGLAKAYLREMDPAYGKIKTEHIVQPAERVENMRGKGGKL